MRLLLNAGFGAPIGPENLAAYRALGFSGVRQDLLKPTDTTPLIGEILRAGLYGLFIVRDPFTAAVMRGTLAGDGAVEIGNEEDARMSPRAYHRHFMEVYEALGGGGPLTPQVFTCGITTTDKGRLSWLEQVYAFGIPEGVGCAIHTYRSTVAPWVSHKGFNSRAEEYRAVREIIGPRRRLIVSEIGWHTTPSRHRYGPWGLFSRRVQFTDADVARFALAECKIAAAHGVESLTWFQANDGQDPKQYEHTFGIRRLDGTWKPVADALRHYAQVGGKR